MSDESVPSYITDAIRVSVERRDRRVFDVAMVQVMHYALTFREFWVEFPPGDGMSAFDSYLDERWSEVCVGASALDDFVSLLQGLGDPPD